MEATGAYSEAIAPWLLEQGHTVSVVNPAQISAYAQSQLIRVKTDAQDANTIARFCIQLNPSAWQPPHLEERTLLALVRDKQVLEQMLSAESNRLLVAHHSIKPRIERHLAWLHVELSRMQGDIDQHIDKHPQLKSKQALLMSIPAIGKHTVAWLLTMLAPQRFAQPKQVVAYAGLSPMLWQSGSSVHKRACISKTGHAELRRVLCMPAMVAYAKMAVYQGFVQRLKKAGKPPKVIIVALMRKLLTIAFEVVKSGKPFDQHLYLSACGS